MADLEVIGRADLIGYDDVWGLSSCLPRPRI